MPSFESIFRQFHDKITAQNIADTVLANPDRLPALMDCFFHEDMRICQRAAWSVGLVGKANSELIVPYVPAMLEAMKSPVHNAVLRNSIRTFQFMDFPEVLEGIVFDRCLSLLLDHDSAIATKVFSMTVCGNICLKYPELSHELIPIIEEQLPHGSTGFKNRGMKLLVKLRAAISD